MKVIKLAIKHIPNNTNSVKRPQKKYRNRTRGTECFGNPAKIPLPAKNCRTEKTAPVLFRQKVTKMVLPKIRKAKWDDRIVSHPKPKTPDPTV